MTVLFISEQSSSSGLSKDSPVVFHGPIDLLFPLIGYHGHLVSGVRLVQTTIITNVTITLKALIRVLTAKFAAAKLTLTLHHIHGLRLCFEKKTRGNLHS